MERWLRQARRSGSVWPDEEPLALSAEGRHGPVVHATNAAGRAAGVQVGARVVDMQALSPTLRVAPTDPGDDRAALERLALWAQRWCPWTVAEPDGLLLDITGSDHLWGGAPAMLAEIAARLARAGFAAHPAVAPTRGAAWALARFGPRHAICDDPADLRPLPAAALRLSAETVLLLDRLGLKTVGDLADVPRLPLARRFAKAAPEDNPPLRLDQAMGRMPEPLTPAVTPPDFRAELRLAEPILDPAPCLPGLCANLCDQLTRAGAGVRRLALSVYRTDGELRTITAGIAAPSRDAAHLAGLFRDRLERIDPGFGFDQVTLAATVTESLAPAQNLLSGRQEAGTELAHLLDRLSARFGAARLTRPALHDSHVPERAEAPAGLMAAPPPAPSRTDRPIRLLDPPEEVEVLYAVPEGPPAQFRWRRGLHRVVRHAGPERIAPEWWRDRSGTRLRDYFQIEDDRGSRYWLYREGLHQDGRGGEPRWFLHGIFP